MNRKILALAIPNIISNITIPLIGMVDMAIAGRMGNDSFIGALAIGGTIFNFIYWNFGFLRMGTTGLVAQAYGARNFPEVTAVLVRSLVVGLIAGLLLVVAQRGVGWLAFAAMNGSHEVMGHAAEYFYARIWAAPANLALFALNGFFIGMQNSRFPMYVSILINLLNVAFCLWFVFGLDWGIAGLGWAAVVSQYSGLLLTVVLWLRHYRRFLKYVDVRRSLDMKPMLHFMHVNRDIFLRTLCIVGVYTFFTAASSGMGDTLLAVNAVLMQLFTLFSYMMDGFAYAAESLIGKYVGARNAGLVQAYLKRLLLWSGGVAVLYVTGYIFFGENLLTLFTDSPAILAEAHKYIGWVIVVPLIGFAPFLIDGALIGATATQVMRNSVFWSTVAFFACYYALRGFMGNNALWLAFIVFLVMRGVLQYVMTNGLKNFK